MLASKQELENILAVKSVFQVVILVTITSGIARVVAPMTALWGALLLTAIQSVITYFLRTRHE